MHHHHHQINIIYLKCNSIILEAPCTLAKKLWTCTFMLHFKCVSVTSLQDFLCQVFSSSFSFFYEMPIFHRAESVMDLNWNVCKVCECCWGCILFLFLFIWPSSWLLIISNNLRHKLWIKLWSLRDHGDDDGGGSSGGGLVMMIKVDDIDGMMVYRCWSSQ